MSFPAETSNRRASGAGFSDHSAYICINAPEAGKMLVTMKKRYLNIIASFMAGFLSLSCEEGNEDAVTDYAAAVEGAYICYMDAMRYDPAPETNGWRTLVEQQEETAVISVVGPNRLSINLGDIAFPDPESSNGNVDLGVVEVDNVMVVYSGSRYALSGTDSIEPASGAWSGTVYAAATIDRSGNCTMTLLLDLRSQVPSEQTFFKLTFTTDPPDMPEPAA